MTDVHSPERRSRNMRSIRSKNTVPEMILRKLLFSRGFRFRLHVADMPGKPDIVLPKYRVAVFMHGCFWHGHGCYLFKLPQVRTEFWAAKIGQNHERDLRAMEQLRVGGWRVLVVWECALKGRLKQSSVVLGDQVEAWIRNDPPTPENQFLSVSHIEVTSPLIDVSSPDLRNADAELTGSAD